MKQKSDFDKSHLKSSSKAGFGSLFVVKNAAKNERIQFIGVCSSESALKQIENR